MASNAHEQATSEGCPDSLFRGLCDWGTVVEPEDAEWMNAALGPLRFTFDSMQEHNEALLAENRALNERLAAVEALHPETLKTRGHPDGTVSVLEVCDVCNVPPPCPTVRAARGEGE